MFSFRSSDVEEMRKKEVIEFCNDCVRCNKPVYVKRSLCGAIYHGASLAPDFPLISLCLYFPAASFVTQIFQNINYTAKSFVSEQTFHITASH